MQDDDTAYWRDVPGTSGKYQVSRGGTVRRVYATGVRDLMQIRIKRGGNNRYVRLMIDGQVKQWSVNKVVSMAWLGPAPPGMVSYHINGLQDDNRLDNIAYAYTTELGKRFGHRTSTRRAVLKIDREGNVVEIYRSARAAAIADYISRQAVLDRCYNKVKKPYSLNGYNYQFED